MRLGATASADGKATFLVWAPRATRVDVKMIDPGARAIRMEQAGRGYFVAQGVDARPGARYAYVLDGALERPDPASRYQPLGVHGPSEVLDDDFQWTDANWSGPDLRDYIIYELHVGTFTAAGTLDAVADGLPDLMDLGVTAVELMPVAQFSGERNWGYDGAYPFAVQSSYGGPLALKRLVDACHRYGLAVILDVVYNHLGPEGNYLADFGPYFTQRYRTPWGNAMNFDGPGSDEVRRYFIENALGWLTDYHVDALRLDAVHAIVDASARPFLRELAEAAHGRAAELGRNAYLIAESDLNDSRLIRSPEAGGFGLDAQWSDDFHHAMHALLTDERNGYYADFGQVAHLARAYAKRYVYAGEYSRFRQRRHGNGAQDLPPWKFVVCAQNHDQVGNRLLGERLTALVDFESLKLAAGLVLLSPYLPLLFMGEEYGETAPFQYFVNHADPALIEAVRKGRREEFVAFHWSGAVPDPQDEETFLRSRVRAELRAEGDHARLYDLYKALIRLRKSVPALSPGARTEVECSEDSRFLQVRQGSQEAGGALVVYNLGEGEQGFELAETAWRLVLSSSDTAWGGPSTASVNADDATRTMTVRIPARSFVLLLRESGD